jgi:membrane protein DedA with SNARE-associated domain
MALMLFIPALSVASTFNSTAAYFLGILMHYSYAGILFLMMLESASLPVPSEVVLPAIGYLAAHGQLSLQLGVLAAIVGSMIGITIDYYVAYFIGKKYLYKHLSKLHIKKATLKHFDRWFNENGAFAVFISREIPIVRGLISFPAGFAGMPFAKFFVCSLAGTAIWDVVLTLFGYYALRTSNLVYEIAAVALFAVILYVVYVVAIRRIRHGKG